MLFFCNFFFQIPYGCACKCGRLPKPDHDCQRYCGGCNDWWLESCLQKRTREERLLEPLQDGASEPELVRWICGFPIIRGAYSKDSTTYPWTLWGTGPYVLRAHAQTKALSEGVNTSDWIPLPSYSLFVEWAKLLEPAIYKCPLCIDTWI
jgi:hypothetical protein